MVGKIDVNLHFWALHTTFFLFFTIFADRMNKGHKQTISTRFISTAFMVLAIAIFKPFSLEVWEWQAYVHLLVLFVLGMFSCFLTEVILKYLVGMPRSYERGVSYIISRNLRFQFINTPLVSLLICLYRHFVMSSLAEGNKLSLSNYFETLLIIAFLVNLGQVDQIVSHSGSTQLVMKHCHDAVPVSRSNMAQIRAAIKNLL